MKTYEIMVNNKTYIVRARELESDDVVSNVQTTTTYIAPPPAAPVVPVTQTSSQNTKIYAPMPGNIVDIKVSVGDKVTSGQVLCILEAMKMENEIVASTDGVVSNIYIKKGDMVDADTVLFDI